MPSGRPGQELGREVAEGADHARADQRDLREQVRLALADLGRLRVAVARGAALQDVGDEDVVAREADALEHLAEELPGGPDERDALEVLVVAGRLADEHHVGVGVAVAHDDLGAPLAERAPDAVDHLGAVVGLERGDPVGAVGHGGRLPRGPAGTSAACDALTRGDMLRPSFAHSPASRRGSWSRGVGRMGRPGGLVRMSGDENGAVPVCRRPAQMHPLPAPASSAPWPSCATRSPACALPAAPSRWCRPWGRSTRVTSR